MIVSKEADAILRYTGEDDDIEDSFLPSASIKAGTVEECLKWWRDAELCVLSIEVYGQLYVGKGIRTLSQIVGSSLVGRVSEVVVDDTADRDAAIPIPASSNLSPVAQRVLLAAGRSEQKDCVPELPSQSYISHVIKTPRPCL